MAPITTVRGPLRCTDVQICCCTGWSSIIFDQSDPCLHIASFKLLAIFVTQADQYLDCFFVFEQNKTLLLLVYAEGVVTKLGFCSGHVISIGL